MPCELPMLTFRAGRGPPGLARSPGGLLWFPRFYSLMFHSSRERADKNEHEGVGTCHLHAPINITYSCKLCCNYSKRARVTRVTTAGRRGICPSTLRASRVGPPSFGSPLPWLKTRCSKYRGLGGVPEPKTY